MVLYMNRVAELIPGFERFLIVLASNAYFHVWMKKVYLGRVLKYSIRYLLRWNQNFFSGNKTGHETDDKPNERKKFEFLNARNSLWCSSWLMSDGQNVWNSQSVSHATCRKGRWRFPDGRGYIVCLSRNIQKMRAVMHKFSWILLRL